MFTVNRLLEQWLVKPYGGGHAEIHPCVGGRYELFWDKNSRKKNSTFGCKVTAVDPGKFLSFEWKGSGEFASFMNSADPLTHVVVFFIPAGTFDLPVTEVHLVHTGGGGSS